MMTMEEQARLVPLTRMQDGSRAQTLSAQTAREIGLQILAGEVEPGEALPQEFVLVEDSGVSRTAIREVIEILEAKGPLESRPKLGVRVLPRWNWRILDQDLLSWQQTLPPDRERSIRLTESRFVAASSI